MQWFLADLMLFAKPRRLEDSRLARAMGGVTWQKKKPASAFPLLSARRDPGLPASHSKTLPSLRRLLR